MPELPVYAPLGEPFIELDSVDSTNNYALSKAYAGLTQHGAVFFARDQQAGKGQRGKTWSSEPGSSVAMSVVYQPAPMDPTRQFQLSASIAVAVCETLTTHTGTNFKIKWPNDLYWQDRKAGGILIENIIRAGNDNEAVWRFAVAGIGINVNQESFNGLANPVSLRQITGIVTDPVVLAKNICPALQHRFGELRENGFPEILRLYNEWLFRRDEKALFRQGNRKFEATVKGITAEGQLVLEHAMTEEFGFGEIEWILNPA